MRRTAQNLALAGLLSIGVLVGESSTVRPAAAAASVSALTFSTDMTAAFEPAGDRGIEFGNDNGGVFVTFTYTDLPAGSKLTRIVKINNEDFNYDSYTYGFLTCCPQGGNGRYGFRILRINGAEGELPGGAYSVFIFLNDNPTPIMEGSFGVEGDVEDDEELPGGNNEGKEEDEDEDDD